MIDKLTDEKNAISIQTRSKEKITFDDNNIQTKLKGEI